MTGHPPGPGPVPKTSSRWSEIEDNILKQAVARHGVSRWDEVAKLIWTKKSAEECRARWAEIVPRLHDELAQREHDLGQQRRKRSMTASASASNPLQDEEATYFEPLPPSLSRGQENPGLEESPRSARGIQSVVRDRSDFQHHTEPPSPSLRVPSAKKPPPSSLAAALIARGRRNTEPGARPSQTTPNSSVGERPGREWIAPHPLMPGRSRKQTVSQNTAGSENKYEN